MIYFITALYCEAKPIIKRYKMKRLTDINVFQVFKGQDCLLTVSGTGGVNSSVSAARLFTLFPPEAVDFAVNIGTCGSKGSHRIGQTVLCNKIIDKTTDRKFYPDMFFKHPFYEDLLESYPKIVEHSQESFHESTGVVDMEGAAFYQAAINFFPSHKIYVLKIVSDFASPENVTAQKIEKMIEACLEEIMSWLDAVGHYSLEDIFKFSNEDLEIIRQVEENLKLSSAMKIHFRKLAKNYKVRKGSLTEILERYGRLVCLRKEDRNRYYEELSGELTQ